MISDGQTEDLNSQCDLERSTENFPCYMMRKEGMGGWWERGGIHKSLLYRYLLVHVLDVVSIITFQLL